MNEDYGRAPVERDVMHEQNNNQIRNLIANEIKALYDRPIDLKFSQDEQSYGIYSYEEMIDFALHCMKKFCKD